MTNETQQPKTVVNNPTIIRQREHWTREAVESDQARYYIFGDNETDHGTKKQGDRIEVAVDNIVGYVVTDDEVDMLAYAADAVERCGQEAKEKRWAAIMAQQEADKTAGMARAATEIGVETP